MLEAEAAFADMDDAMDIAEECIKSCYYSMMHQCPDDVQLLRDRGSKTSKPSAASTEDAAYATLDESMANDFARMTYTDAIQALQDSGEKFQYSVEWGVDLKFEHEQWLASSSSMTQPLRFWLT